MSDERIISGKQPLNLEQAVNYLAEHQKHVKEDIKKQVASSQITIAPVNDRIRYLIGGVAYLSRVGIVDERVYRLLPEKLRNMFSRKDMAEFFERFLYRKIYFMPNEQVSKETGVPLHLIEKVEVLAIEAVKLAIEHIQATCLPIVGNS